MRYLREEGFLEEWNDDFNTEWIYNARVLTYIFKLENNV